jgi:hypothetical protein
MLAGIGMAVVVVCITWRSIVQVVIWLENSPGIRRVWRAFCHHGTEPIEQDVYRGTMFLDEWKFITVYRLSK